MSELEKKLRRSLTHTNRNQNYRKLEKLHGVRTKASKETGVPEDMLYGATEEECKMQAEKILKFAQPEVSDGGESKGHGNKSSVDIIALKFCNVLKNHTWLRFGCLLLN